ncbi:MAG TPA: hypothetical protein VLT33_04075, partial [Labilithrix sp.]|nr:hypothetical protein [Labilithrix sp.]
MRRMIGLALGVLTLVSVGCGAPEGRSANAVKGSRSGRLAPAQPFPSRQALEKLAAAPVTPLPARTVAAAPEWKLQGAGADAVAPVEARYAQVATKTGAAVTFAKELRCVARELGRFHLENDAYPDERLRRFLIAACGLTNPAIVAAESHGAADPSIADEEILADWQKKLAIPAEVRGSALGVWMGRKGKRVVIMTVAQKTSPGDMVITNEEPGQVTVRGTAPLGSETVIGLVNQGEHGVARCAQDLATPLPLYAFRCALGEGDATAWIEVAARAQGRLLLRSVGLGLARRDVAVPYAYVAAPRDVKNVTSSAELASAVLDGVNRARAKGKLAPLTLAGTQTATNGRFAPHFFQASQQHDDSDQIGLGLLAGWDVEGTIRNGNLFAALLSGTSNANAWLDYALESPMGRFTMLEPEARQIAVGVSAPGALGGLGAVVTTYQMFGSTDHRADVAHVFAGITKLRAARGLAQPIAMADTAALAAEATFVNTGRKDAQDALDAALVAVRNRTHQGVRGWIAMTNDLDSIPFPPELLGAPSATVGIEVTHVRNPGAAWG